MDYASYVADEPVLRWLEEEGLGQYVESFRRAHITQPESFFQLDTSYFDSLGIINNEDRNKVYYLIEKLRKEFRQSFAAAAFPAMSGDLMEDDRKPGGHSEQSKQVEKNWNQNLGFEISKTKRYKPNGTVLCRADGCDKIAQAKCNGFCRHHFKLFAKVDSAAKESKWACICGAKNPFKARRCGTCNRWKDKRRSVPEEETAPTDEFGNVLPKTHVPSDSGVVISETRRLNERGRQLCKVEGCNKLRQARNDGFCRYHFNLFAINQVKPASLPTAAATAAPEDGAKVADDRKPPAATKTADWLCSCGTTNPGKQTRCGSCQRWKGGKRQTIPKKKKPEASLESAGAWDCDKCGNRVLASKSRCGQCHHWRGGKRKCGWTIRGKGDDGSIPWHLEWSCCDVTYSPDKRRCGKCQKWRGGKRTKSKGRKRQHTVEQVPALPYPVYQSQLHPVEMMQQAVQAVEAHEQHAGMAMHQQEWNQQQQAYIAEQMAIAHNNPVQQQRVADV
mmetsp:Transcript_15627/g.34267  ORF Transcript_15627/g.34267 Transcript_15627/m.34267 type:complete len:504 (+) Transcript_15627:287-1798(+)